MTNNEDARSDQSDISDGSDEPSLEAGRNLKKVVCHEEGTILFDDRFGTESAPGKLRPGGSANPSS